MLFKRLLSLLLLLMVSELKAKGVQHLLWDKTPLTITLALEQERVISFPLPVKIADSELEKDASILKMQDTLYIKPNKPFRNKRLVVQLMPEGEAIVLILSATEEASDVTPLSILIDQEDYIAERDEGSDKETLSSNEVEKPIDPTLNAVSLTRFAIQSLYSPARLLKIPAGLARTPMRTHKNVLMVYGATVTARPLISWSAADLYVTAIELKNQLNKEVIIDPRQLIGDWQTASLYPTNSLNAHGKNDSTTLFVTSSKPFGEALAANREFVR